MFHNFNGTARLELTVIVCNLVPNLGNILPSSALADLIVL